MTCTVRRIAVAPPPDSNWHYPVWASAETLALRHFRPESGNHRPQTFARVLHDEHGIHGLFQVHDGFVRCGRTEYGSEVWKNSCVEFFAQPKPGRGYSNFEFNGGGAFLCCHIVDPTRTPDGFKQFPRGPWDVARQIQVHTSLPRTVEPEITGPVTWTLQFFIPFALFENFIGPLGGMAGQTWRGWIKA